MKAYEKHLKYLGVAMKSMHYYCAWVEQYSEFCESRNLDLLKGVSLDEYISALDKRCKDWMVDQAKESVYSRIYSYWSKLTIF